MKLDAILPLNSRPVAPWILVCIYKNVKIVILIIFRLQHVQAAQHMHVYKLLM